MAVAQSERRAVKWLRQRNAENVSELCESMPDVAINDGRAAWQA
jgi:hypothetical protein